MAKQLQDPIAINLDPLEVSQVAPQVLEVPSNLQTINSLTTATDVSDNGAIIPPPPVPPMIETYQAPSVLIVDDDDDFLIVTHWQAPSVAPPVVNVEVTSPYPKPVLSISRSQRSPRKLKR